MSFKHQLGSISKYYVPAKNNSNGGFSAIQQQKIQNMETKLVEIKMTILLYHPSFNQTPIIQTCIQSRKG